MTGNVAQTILSQLGGNRFVAMTGAKSFTAGPNSLTFKLPGNGFAKDGIRAVVITLTASDLYDVAFYAMRGVNARKVTESTEVFAESLRDVFSAATGLYTSL